MRVFISADIEGVATTTLWSETEVVKEARAEYHAREMTLEVLAACEGAIAAGADYILLKDAHDYGVNIDITQLPECVETLRGWCGSPYSMATGVDEGFDAAMFIGYHSAAGRIGNPLSHTMNTANSWIKLNGRKASEFMLYSWAAAYAGVPTVLLAGDKMLCEDYKDLHPSLITVPVKDGYGGMTRSLQPQKAQRLIRERAQSACSQPLKDALCTLPKEFTLEVCYKEHKLAAKMCNYPGCKLVDDNTISFFTTDYYEVLRTLEFVL